MPNTEFTVLAQLPRVKYDPITRENIEGFDIRYQDAVTATIDTVFVPDAYHNAEQVTAIIMAKLQRIRAVGAL